MINKRIKSLLVGIAGYLHDIGKISQKTGSKLSENEQYSDIIVGSKKGYYHAIFTYKLLNAIFSKNDNYKYLNAAWSASFADIEDIIMTAAIHHNPPLSNKAAQCIKKGDCLAAGLDRDMAEDKVLYEKIKNFKQAKLTSILSIINTESVNEPKPHYYKQLKVNSDNICPKSKLDEPLSNDETRYQEIEKSLISDLNYLLDNLTSSDEENMRMFADGIEGTMLSNASLIPAATTDKDFGVSLYEHAKLTAAFAAASFNTENNLHKNNFLLIRGEFFSIQKFIFNKGSSNKNPAKILRGKSFYVSLMTEAAALMFLDACDLPIFNILQNGAGKFLILAADTKEYVEKSFAVKEKINSWLYDKFYGQVSFGLSIESVPRSDFCANKFDSIWLKLIKNSDKEKASRFNLPTRKAVFSDYYKKFDKRDASLCQYCLTEVSESSGSCKNCDTYESIGSRLTSSKSLTFFKSQDGLFGEIGYTFDKYEKHIGTFLSSIAIDANEPFSGARINHYKSYVNINNTGEVSTFEDLAKHAKGAGLLGVLKADVDNLGIIFAYGLGRDTPDGFHSNLSFSRLNAISRNIHMFFAQLLQDMMKAKRYKVYTVFAGGDDLFIVGAYSDIIDLSFDIESRLKEYTGQNQDITISAGIALFNKNTPIWFMAEEAENLLEKSKTEGKNRISLLGATATWDDFRTAQKSYNEELRIIFEDKDIPTAFFYKVMRLADMSLKYEENKNYKLLMWRSYLRYMVARMQEIDDYKKDFLLRYLESMLSNKPDLLKAFIQITLYNNRTREVEDE